MPAAEETTGDPAIDSDPSDPDDPSDLDDLDEAPERAGAGAARSTRRRHVRRLIVPLVLVVLAVVAVRGATLGQDGESDRSGSGERSGDDAGEEPPAETTAPSGAEDGAGGTGTSANVPSTTSSSVAPPDVARPRPAVDLAAQPDGDDPIELARWWAATFVAYDAAEASPDLVARLDPFTTDELRQALLARPPAASYDAPLDIAGASAQAEGTGAPAGSQRVTVAVETPGALVVYRLALVQGGAGTWQVSEAARV